MEVVARHPVGLFLAGLLFDRFTVPAVVPPNNVCECHCPEATCFSFIGWFVAGALTVICLPRLLHVSVRWLSVIWRGKRPEPGVSVASSRSLQGAQRLAAYRR
eukprot:206207-Amphidinium_carterae.1